MAQSDFVRTGAFMRGSWRVGARAVVLAAATFGAMLLPLAPAEAVVTIPVRSAEVPATLTSGRGVVPLPFRADHVALHWLGDPDADVEVSFRTGTGPFRRSFHAGAGDAGRDPARSYGQIVSAVDATAVRIEADRPLRDLRVVAFTDEEAVVRYRSAPRTAQALAQPDVISRAEWGADESLRSGSPDFAPIEKLVIHHTVTGESADPKSTIRAIYEYHTQSQGWSDIGYNFLVDAWGRVYEGRWARNYAPGEEPTGENTAQQGVIGAHAGGFNTGSMGVALLGNFTSTTPSTAARDALAGLLAWKAERHDIDPLGSSTFNSRWLPNIFGHRDVRATACPGDAFYPQLPAVRNDVADRLTLAEFHPLTPERILDTRWTDPPSTFKSGEMRWVAVSRATGVPSSGVSAVALNVTAAKPSASGYLTVYPAGQPRPNASSVNFVAGQDVANHVVAKLSSTGKIAVYNSSGTTDVIIDVFGYYAEPTDTSTGGHFTPLPEPIRFHDTRRNKTAVGEAKSIDIAIRGQHGVPLDATAVVANVTVTEPTKPSHVKVYPAKELPPNVSTLNFVAGQTVPNLAVVKLGADGSITAYNHQGAAHVIIDVVGWFAPDNGTLLHPVTPGRVLDSRWSRGLKGPLDGGVAHRLDVTNVVNGVPTLARSVVLNVTVTEPKAAGYLTVWPTGTPEAPDASNLNFVAGQTVANLVVARVGSDGAIQLYVSSASAHVVADVVGWYGTA